MVMVPLTGKTEAVINVIVVSAVVIFEAILSFSLIISCTDVILLPICGKYVLEFPFELIDLDKTENLLLLLLDLISIFRTFCRILGVAKVAYLVHGQERTHFN